MITKTLQAHSLKVETSYNYNILVCFFPFQNTTHITSTEPQSEHEYNMEVQVTRPRLYHKIKCTRIKMT